MVDSCPTFGNFKGPYVKWKDNIRMWYESNRAGTELQKAQYIIRCFGRSEIPKDHLSHTVLQTWLGNISKEKPLRFEDFNTRISVFKMMRSLDKHFKEDEDMRRVRLETEWGNSIIHQMHCC